MVKLAAGCQAKTLVGWWGAWLGDAGGAGRVCKGKGAPHGHLD